MPLYLKGILERKHIKKIPLKLYLRLTVLLPILEGKESEWSTSDIHPYYHPKLILWKTHLEKVGRKSIEKGLKTHLT